jgi:hypothetical protein
MSLLSEANIVRVSALGSEPKDRGAECQGPEHETTPTSATPAGDRRVETVPVSRLIAYKGNARTHSRKQIRQIADSIKRFGFLNPVLVDDANKIIAGHGRVEAAKLLGLAAVPALRVSHLTDAEKRAYVLADNRLAELAGWDREILAIELQGLVDIGFEVEVTGFLIPQIDLVLDQAAEAKDQPPGPEDEIPDAPAASACVSRAGDLWTLGDHRLLCGNALDAASYETLMAGARAEMVFTDPPYNVRILAADIGLAGFALGIERREGKIEIMLGRFAGVRRRNARVCARHCSWVSLY